MLPVSNLPADEPVRYILDTDIASDCDDAGAVAMANALADNGEVDILAMMVSTGGLYGAPALCAINTWYGHGDLPIGTLKNPSFWVGGSMHAPAGSFNYESYNRHLAESFPTRIKSGHDAADAQILYRQILAAQPDQSVTINTIGPLINLANLMKTGPDMLCSLNGMELIQRKVRLLVVAGGCNPKGTSSNFSKEDAGVHAKPVIDHWPTPIVFVGNEIGGDIQTGWTRNAAATQGNPARTAYRLFHAGDGTKKRASWDQAAVLYAIRGTGSVYALAGDGHLSCTPDGQTTWISKPAAGKRHAYLRKLDNANARIAEVIEELMTQAPRQTSGDQL